MQDTVYCSGDLFTLLSVFNRAIYCRMKTRN